ncbi:MAG: hypothetical protein RBU21_17270 [FCB group bacterium]|nr:hypothetical protein [FCB group bacterium]
MKRILCTVLLAGWALAAAGQESGGEPSNFRFLNADGASLELNFETGVIEKIHGPAELELIPSDPSSPPMVVKGNEITFRYAEGNSEPEVLVLVGNVSVSHPRGNILADNGEWNRRTGNLVFEGKPATLKLKEGGDLIAQKITFNMDTGQMSAEGGFQLRKVPLSGMSGTPGASSKEQSAYLLTAKDVTDWPTLIGGVKKQAAADGPSPGKQIMAQFDPALRKQFSNVVDDKAPNASTQSELVKALNKALKAKSLYDAEAWKGVELPADAQELAKKEERSAEEVVKLNRRLIEAAYPGAIAPKS